MGPSGGGFPKLGYLCVGALNRITVFWDPYSGPLLSGNYHVMLQAIDGAFQNTGASLGGPTSKEHGIFWPCPRH